jgi:hypothetical protein
MQKRLAVAFCLWVWITAPLRAGPDVSLTLVPPSPVTDQVAVEVRGAVWNRTERARTAEVWFYLDEERPDRLLHRGKVEVLGGAAKGISFRWQAKGLAGRHRIVQIARFGEEVFRAERPLEVLASSVRSPRRIDGAWIMFDIPSDAGGSTALEASRKLTDEQWAEIVRAMHAIGMNVVVVECVFDNFACRPGEHRIDREGYRGKAYYPSRLFPGRAALAATNPVEAVLAAADRLGMDVFLGVGWYVWGEYTPAALAWHKQVADELHAMFAHHPSFYGWYVSGESTGDLGGSPKKQGEVVEFFREFRSHCRRLAPDKPVMLAPQCDYVPKAAETWRRLVREIDIVCPFGQHRLPADDVPAEETVRLLQSLCDEAGSHLWFDLETFVFGPGGGLVPRAIDSIVDDLDGYPTFEKVLCFQYPGLLNAPWSSSQVGGPSTVALYRAYEQYLRYGADYRRHVDPSTLRERVQHAAVGKPVALAAFPDPRYPGGGRNGLTDGYPAARSRPFHHDQNWQGYWGADLTATIDLGRTISLAAVRSDYLQHVGSGIYLPRRVEYAVSDDGLRFRTVAALANEVPIGRVGPLVQPFEAKLNSVAGRYVRVLAENVRAIPAGLPAAGEKAWLFVDEIAIQSSRDPR